MEFPVVLVVFYMESYNRFSRSDTTYRCGILCSTQSILQMHLRLNFERPIQNP
ncbi:hypothetical protein L9F63_022259, partial [Diploptera punctata]